MTDLAPANNAPAYKRILLKLSGEALMGDDAFGINRATIVRMVEEIAEITRMGVEVAVVIGGGNIFRGVAGGSVGMDRATADYMGMCHRDECVGFGRYDEQGGLDCTGHVGHCD